MNTGHEGSMRPSVLYISYTGLLDPLGESQVLQYVLGLARDHRMTLLTFEKAAALADRSRLAELQLRCREAGVEWRRLRYHNRPTMPATLYDLIAGALAAIRLARGSGADIVHCRSYLASLMGLLVKRATGVRHIFDMRGFWPDERADGGIWRRDSFRYRLFKRLERTLFLGTDQVVSLTRAGSAAIQGLGYFDGRLPPISVIPTCTNLELFRPAGDPGGDAGGFTLGYVGSVGSWYLFEPVAAVVKLLFEADPGSRFLVINRGGHDFIRDILATAGVDLTRVEIRAVPFPEVAKQIARMDAGVFFYRPDWSRKASCPTRLGEFLALGKPCLANRGVGDVESTLVESGTGVVIDVSRPADYAAALAQLMALARTPGMATRCRAVAEARFSLRDGIERYARIYASLAGRGSA